MGTQAQGGAKQAPPEDKSKAKADADAKVDETKPDTQAKPLETKRFQQPKPKEQGETEIYHVASGTTLVHEGKVHRGGDELLLSESYAKSLGDSVVRGEAPKPDVPEERKAGKYRVCEGFHLYHGGKLRKPGFVVELNADEARKQGDAVTPV